ncbi:ATP-dependent DNA ligase, partial [Bacillus safensis]|nr:ATP-dependent DNA ligase [Bacillus safensis]
LKNKEAIQRQAERFPCHFIAFDLLRCKGKPLVDLPLTERKNQLQQVFQDAKLPSSVQLENPSLLQVIHSDPDSEYM